MCEMWVAGASLRGRARGRVCLGMSVVGARALVRRVWACSLCRVARHAGCRLQCKEMKAGGFALKELKEGGYEPIYGF